MSHHGLRLLRRRISEEQDWRADPGGTQFDALIDCGHPEHRRPGVQSRVGDRDGPMSVGVRLDHGQEPGAFAQQTAQGAHVVPHSTQVDFGPDAQRSPRRRAGTIRGQR